MTALQPHRVRWILIPGCTTGLRKFANARVRIFYVYENYCNSGTVNHGNTVVFGGTTLASARELTTLLYVFSMDMHRLISAVFVISVSLHTRPVAAYGGFQMTPNKIANGGSVTLGWDISSTVFHFNPGETGKILLFCPPSDEASLDTAVDSKPISSDVGTVTFGPLVNMRNENCQFRLYLKETMAPDLAGGIWDFSFTKGQNEPTQAHLSMVSVPNFYQIICMITNAFQRTL